MHARKYCSRACAIASRTDQAIERRRRCACGCGNPVNNPKSRYIAGHVPTSERQKYGQKGGSYQVKLRRFRRYRSDLDRLLKEGRINRGELETLLETVYQRAYIAGYHAGRRAAPRKSVTQDVLDCLSDGQPHHRKDMGASTLSVACALSRLKNRGVVEQVGLGVWRLTAQSRQAEAA